MAEILPIRRKTPSNQSINIFDIASIIYPLVYIDDTPVDSYFILKCDFRQQFQSILISLKAHGYGANCYNLRKKNLKILRLDPARRRCTWYLCLDPPLPLKV